MEDSGRRRIQGRRDNAPGNDQELPNVEKEQAGEHTDLSEMKGTVLNPRDLFPEWTAIVDAIRPAFSAHVRSKGIRAEDLRGSNDFFELVSNVVSRKRDELKVTPDQLPRLTKMLEVWFFDGLGIMGTFLDKIEGLEEIDLNRWDVMFVTANGVRKRVASPFQNEQEVYDFLQRIFAQQNREINDANPSQEGKLIDGSRIQANIPPHSAIGPCFSIRKFRPIKFTMEEYVERNFCTQEFVDDVTDWIRNRRYNILVVGGTGSGKTTALNAFGSLMSPEDRVVIVESTKELQIALGQDNEIYLQNTGTGTGAEGGMTIRDGLKDALRLFPDRIIVGEVRGAEARDMLQAMNTGHDGSFGTFHANTAREAIGRLQSMALEASEQTVSIQEDIAWAVDIIIVVTRERTDKGYHRHVKEVWQFFHPNQVDEDHHDRLRELRAAKQIWNQGPICGICLFRTPLATGVLQKVNEPLPLTGKG